MINLPGNTTAKTSVQNENPLLVLCSKEEFHFRCRDRKIREGVSDINFYHAHTKANSCNCKQKCAPLLSQAQKTQTRYTKANYCFFLARYQLPLVTLTDHKNDQLCAANGFKYLLTFRLGMMLNFISALRIFALCPVDMPLAPCGGSVAPALRPLPAPPLPSRDSTGW